MRSYALTSSEVWETHFQGMGKTLKSGDRDRTCLQVTRHSLTVTLLWSTACVHHGKASTTRGMRDGYGVTPSCDISFICSSFLSSFYLACSQKRPTSQLLRCLFTKKKKKGLEGQLLQHSHPARKGTRWEAVTDCLQLLQSCSA